jgi:hypothetical protein
MKCNFETDCKGNGTCCFDCYIFYNCKHTCKIIDMNKNYNEILKDVNNCDWRYIGENEN